MRMSFKQAITPRAFEHWNRDLGCLNRVKIQAWQTLAKRPVERLNSVVPGENLRLGKAVSWINRNIEALQQSHAVSAENVLESVNDGVMFLTSEGKIEYINQKLLDFSGYSLKETLGEGPWKFVRKDYVMPVLDYIQKVLNGEKIEPTEVVIIKKDGNGLPAEFTASLLTSASGIQSINVVVRDISERKRGERDLKASEARFRAITEMAQDAVMMVTGHEVSLSNPAAERVFGYKAGELRGRKFYELLVPKHARQMHESIMDRFAKTGEAATVGKTLEVTAKHKDGHDFPIELSISSVRFDNKWHAIMIVRDVTERKKSEREIAAQKINLARLRTANRALLNMADHFSQIWPGGIIDLIEMDIQGLKKEVELARTMFSLERHNAIKKRIEEIKESLVDMRKVMTRGRVTLADVRTFAAPMRELNLEKQEIDELISCCVAESEAQIRSTRRTGLPEIEVDVEFIQDALSRFIRSAADAIANMNNGKIRIDAVHVGSEIRISVEDNGPRNDNLFVGVLQDPPFVHGQTYNYGEYLSLSIALKYVKAHGGRIFIDNKNGQGRVVEIWLPIEAK